MRSAAAVNVAAPPPATIADEAVSAGETAPAPAPQRVGITPKWLLGVWLAGVAVVLGRLGAGHLRLWLAAGRAVRIDSPDWSALIAPIGRRLGLRRPVALLETSETDVPLTYGLFRATVLLPRSAAEWDIERRRVVLLHELIHVRRRDPLLHAAARLASALYWFHPLAWLAVARLQREQERSCDDAAVRAGAGRSDYARHLVDLARSLMPAGAGSAALAMAVSGGLEPRVHALLDPHRKRNAPGRRICLAAAAAAICVTLPLAALRAQDSKASASLGGSVYHASGAAIPGARILLENVDGSNVEVARSGADGTYSLSAIPAGTYKMHAGAAGLAEMQKTLVLAPGAVQQLNIILDVGQVTDAVEVAGKGPRPRPVAQPRRIRVRATCRPPGLSRLSSRSIPREPRPPALKAPSCSAP